LWKATWSSISDVNFFELDWTMTRHNALLDTFVPMTFLGNHDVTRIASRIADARNLPHAVVVLATVGGVPSIYYGDEYAHRAVKEERLGGDDAIRPEFPSRPGQPDGEAKFIYSLYRELFGLRRRLAWLVQARTSTLHLANSSYVYRSVADGQSIVVALNIADQPVEVPSGGGRQLLAGHGEVRGDRLLVPGHGWAVLAP
jgi:cyclomaltodextrinase